MKKLLVIALSALVSACACFDCADENERPVVYQTTSKNKTLDCDYFDGKTCYRYIYKNVQRKVAKPEPMLYRPCGAPAVQPAAPCGCQQRRIEAIAPAPAPAPVRTDNCCQDKITESREPVEMVYKKVTTKTTYEPKTSSEVSYEKVPYTSGMTLPAPVEVVAPATTTATTTTTTTTSYEEIK